MKSQISIFLISFFILVVGFILTACNGEILAPTVTVAFPQNEVAPTRTSIPPSETPPPQSTATNTVQIPTRTEPVLTATSTSTSTPEPTPIACEGVLTPPQQEGPFFSPGSPERSTLIDEGMPGIPVLIFGRVFDQDCNPISGAKIDFWLADVNGEYDNVGYTLRGHVFTDEDGNYTLESIEPTAYTGRPPHIHVKVYAPGGEELLTTQMYFAGSEGSAEVSNAPDLFVTYLDPGADEQLQVLFNFIVNY